MRIPKKIFFFIKILAIFILIPLKNIDSKEVKIIMKIDRDIITNIDVENEYKYLTAFNTSLKKIEKEKVLNLAKESLKKEIIKKIELKNYYELNQKNNQVDLMIEDIYTKMGFSNKSDFEIYLKDLELTFNEVYKKIEIETVWNQLIYSKYKQKVIINENNLKKEILSNKKEVDLFFLYELVFDFKNKDEIEKKYEEIIKSISSVGFEETVIKYSIADSKSNFGSLGWINENSLSKKIKDQINTLNVGGVTKPIVVPGGILIIKLGDKKKETLEINLDNELEKRIQYELNIQLNNYSTLHFNKIKNNLIINEY